MPRWTWDPNKAARNLKEHGVSFELAERVFDDPLHASRMDTYPHEERWQTIGRPSAESPLVLLVVHTELVEQDNGEGRIISARKATAAERRAYAEREF